MYIRKKQARIDYKPSQYQHEILDGILISDGYINNKSNSACSISIGQRLDRREFVEYVAKELNLEHSIYEIMPKENWKAKIVNTEARYSSETYPFLMTYLSRWYNEHKIIPSDFVLSPIICLMWYLGDGNLHKDQQVVRLSTCCFTEKEVYLLIEQFHDLKLYAYQSNRREIYFKKQSTDLFFKYIGECPVACFYYKWPKSKIVLGHRANEDVKQKLGRVI